MLGDGCHISRNPAIALQLLLRLLPLRLCYRERRRPIPERMDTAVQQMLAYVGRMQLGDGSMSGFNGAGRSTADAVATVMIFHDPSDASPRWGGLGGYARLEQAGTIVVVDAGSAPPLDYAGAAHASCLAFEISAGDHALFRNCGAPARNLAEHRAAARATTSHNTLAIAGRSSATLVRSRSIERLIGALPLTGPSQVVATVEESAEGQTFTGEHNGYAGLGFQHKRSMTLSPDGRRLAGTDTLLPVAAQPNGTGAQPFAIHFHLAGDVIADLEQDGRSALLRPPAGPLWRFTVTGTRAAIEASVDYADPSGARPSQQIVLRAVASGETAVLWTLQALD